MPEGSPLVAAPVETTTAVTGVGIAESCVDIAHGVSSGERATDLSRDQVDQRFYGLVTDLIGRPVEMIDGSGEPVWRANSGLWGHAVSPAAPGLDCPLRFPGQYHDRETGHDYNHHHHHHHHYDAETARYTSADPLGLAPAPNPYAYVANPWSATDPLGLATYDRPPRLSDPNPIPRQIREQYEEVRLGNGTPRIDPVTGQQSVFEGRGLSPRQRAQWQGSLEWDVPGTSHRILQRPDGNLGYVLDHDYNSPFLFPAPWYQEGGVVPRRLGGPGR